MVPLTVIFLCTEWKLSVCSKLTFINIVFMKDYHMLLLACLYSQQSMMNRHGLEDNINIEHWLHYQPWLNLGKHQSSMYACELLHWGALAPDEGWLAKLHMENVIQCISQNNILTIWKKYLVVASSKQVISLMMWWLKKSIYMFYVYV